MLKRETVGVTYRFNCALTPPRLSDIPLADDMHLADALVAICP